MATQDGNVAEIRINKFLEGAEVRPAPPAALVLAVGGVAGARAAVRRPGEGGRVSGARVLVHPCEACRVIRACEGLTSLVHSYHEQAVRINRRELCPAPRITAFPPKLKRRSKS